MRTGLAVGVLSIATAMSCTRANRYYDPNPALPDECRAGVETTATFTAFPRTEKLDLLFVVDASSDDPAALQEVFANAIAPLGQLLSEMDLDVRAAVATTNSAHGGLIGPGTAAPGCESNDAVLAELDGEWGRTMRCNLFAVADVNPFDEPLEVVDALLTDPPEGFLRDDARLLVVVGTRSDDCSSSEELDGDPREACATAELTRVADFVESWRARSTSPDAMALAVFAGPPSVVSSEAGRPVCSSAVGSALPAARLFETARLLGAQGSFDSVCTDDVFRPLAGVIDAFVARGTATLCPPSAMLHEPLAVRAGGADVPLGEDGVIYLGPTEGCANGALRFAAPALAGVDEIELTYCTEAPGADD